MPLLSLLLVFTSLLKNNLSNFEQCSEPSDMDDLVKATNGFIVRNEAGTQAGISQQ